jgi:gas vesicle protein
MSLSLKISKGKEVRRFVLPTENLTYETLRTKLASLFLLEPSSPFQILYFDDSDWITISSEEEVNAMIQTLSSITNPLLIKLAEPRRSSSSPLVQQFAEQVRPVVHQIAEGMGTVYDKVKPQVETATKGGLELANKAKPFAQNVLNKVEKNAAPVAQQFAEKVSPFAEQVANQFSPLAAQIVPITQRIEEQIKSNESLQQVSNFFNEIRFEMNELKDEIQHHFSKSAKSSPSIGSQTNCTETSEASTTTSGNEVELEQIPEEPVPDFVHYAICDNCRTRIAGWRYKCKNCDDYDLCSNCIISSQSVHPNHNFQKIGKEPIVEKVEETAESVAPVEIPVVEEPVASDNLMSREKLEESIRTLQEMGFSDKPKIIRAIINNKNDLVKAVMELL